MVFSTRHHFTHRDPTRAEIYHQGIFARGKILLLILFPLLFLSGCGATTTNNLLLVSAAANLQPALTTLTPELEQTVGMKVVFNYGSSGKLAQQIEQGAPVDLFLSANRSYVDELMPAGSLVADSITPFARGRLVVWSSNPDRPLVRFADLARPGIGRIAMPNPDHAPYGEAAREALLTVGLWDELQSKLVFSENVTQSFQFAQQGDGDAAFVSASQIVGQEGHWIDVPVDLYHPLEQTAAVAARSSRPDTARAVIQFLLSPTAQAIFRQFGYLPLDEASS